MNLVIFDLDNKIVRNFEYPSHKEKKFKTMEHNNTGDINKCPFMGGTQKQTAGNGTSVRDFWPNELKLNILRQNAVKSNPMGADFNYADAFNSIDFASLKQDIINAMTDSQDWWPADYGNYGPFMVRMAWHSAGTYRVGDGRGGARSGCIAMQKQLGCNMNK